MELVTKLRHENGTSEKVWMSIQPFEIEIQGEWQCGITDWETQKKLIYFK